MAISQIHNASRPASLDAVLHHAWETEIFTATDVMETTGLTRTTAIDAIDTLIGIGLLRELPNAREAGAYRKGRPARRFELASDRAVLVGVDANVAEMTATVADLHSRTLATARRELGGEYQPADDRRDAILAGVDEALTGASRTRDDVLCICIGLPAPVDAHGDSPAHPFGFWQRTNPDLIDAFGEWAPLVRIENDAALAATAEGATGAATSSSDYIFLMVDEGLGAGVVTDGRMLRGAHGGVGEMAALQYVDGVGSPDGVVRRMLAAAQEAAVNGELDPDGPLAAIPTRDLDGRAVLDLAAAGDPEALRIADQVGTILARIVSVLASMFDPELVIVSHPGSDGIHAVVDAARRSLPTDVHIPAPQIEVSELGGDVVVTGALAEAAETAKNRVLDLWFTTVG